MKMVKLHPAPETKFPDIADLKFYRSDKDLYYFNAGEYLKKFGSRPEASIADFMKSFRFLIEALQERNGLAQEDLHVTDTSGNECLEECLVIPFMVYHTPGFGPYIVERMEEVLRLGFTISDTMSHYFYQTRSDNQSE